MFIILVTSPKPGPRASLPGIIATAFGPFENRLDAVEELRKIPVGVSAVILPLDSVGESLQKKFARP